MFSNQVTWALTESGGGQSPGRGGPRVSRGGRGRRVGGCGRAPVVGRMSGVRGVEGGVAGGGMGISFPKHAISSLRRFLWIPIYTQ